MIENLKRNMFINFFLNIFPIFEKKLFKKGLIYKKLALMFLFFITHIKDFIFKKKNKLNVKIKSLVKLVNLIQPANFKLIILRLND